MLTSNEEQFGYVRSSLYYFFLLPWQILVSMCHLIELMTLEDFSLIEELVVNTGNDMKTLITKYGQMLPPAKSTCFLAALKHIKTLRSSFDFTSSQDNAASILEAWLQEV